MYKKSALAIFYLHKFFFHLPTMPVWSRIQGQKNSFTRPLGEVECAFYWDTVYRGISDTASQFTVESSQATADELFSCENVSGAWLVIKKLHPLLGATMQEREDGSWVDFVIDEKRLHTLFKDELVFTSVSSEEEACHLVNKTLNDEPRLSNQLLCQLWIVSQTKQCPPGKAVHHIIVHMRHSIMDGVSVYSMFKQFFDILCRRTVPSIYRPSVPLEKSLEQHPSIDPLNPSKRLPIPVQRWKKAIATVMHNRRLLRMRGGYTLPQTNSDHIPSNPLKCRTFHYQLDREQTRKLLASCRQKGITLGNVFPVLLQLAHAKLTHKLYAKGLISQSEWEHRTKEPTYFFGPFNLRSYLDPEWLENGGSTRCCIAVAWYETILPHMPTARLGNGKIEENPSFDSLLSEKQFLSRCGTSKRQSKVFLKHPLLVEFAELSRSRTLQRSKILADRWRAMLDPGKKELVDMYRPDFTYANGCSTVGDLHTLIPTNYPLDEKEDDIISNIHIRNIRPYLRCRPEELYLTSIALNQQLTFILFADVSKYDQKLVEEWFAYVIEGALWYLGDGANNRRTVQARL